MSSTRRIATVAVALCIVGAAGLFLTKTLLHETQDLSPLAPHAETHNLDALIAGVQATPIGPDGFRFVALGDSRSNKLAASKVLSKAAEEKPVFILANGDVVRHGTVDEYLSHHLPLMAELAPIAFITAPGNHEEGPNRDFAAFNALYGAERFSFDYGGCRFTGFNDCDGSGVGNDDLAYLEQELGKPGAAHKFVIAHIPPDYMEAAGGRGFKHNAKAFRELMTAQQVDRVFLGHVHGYATEVIDGVPYTITGGAGAPLATTLGEEGNVRNFVTVHVTDQGLKTEVVRLLNDEWVRTELP